MSFSLNETEALARAATRGAGLSWGMAEEAGRAVRWLCLQGLDGCAALALALTGPDRNAPGTCPLAAGTALSDGAMALPLELRNVMAPALLLPFAAGAARALGSPVLVLWKGSRAVTDGVALSLAVSSDIAAARSDVVVSRGGEITLRQARQSRATPKPDDWRKLESLARRTLAPVTDESRLKGAGAGTADNTDNDD